MLAALLLSIPLGLFDWFVLQIAPVASDQTLQASLAWLLSLGLALSFRLDGMIHLTRSANE